MKLRKILLSMGICTASLATANIYAADMQATHSLSSQQQSDIKDLITSNLDSLFPYQTQISVGKISQDSRRNVVASDILIMSGGTKNPNISINRLTLVGLKPNQSIDGDFSIKVEGLSITNLASTIANSNIVSAKMDAKELANNQSLFAIIMNTVSQGLYNFDLKYDYSNSTLKFSLDSSVNKKAFISQSFDLADTKLSAIRVDMDFLANLEKQMLDSKIKTFNLDANLTEVIKGVTRQYFGKKYKQTPSFDLKVNLGEKPSELIFDVDATLGDKSYLKYNLDIADIDLEKATVREIVNGSESVLSDAYIKENNADAKIELNFDKKMFPNKSPAQQLLSFLGQDKLHVMITSDRDFSGSKYDTNLNIKADGLASITATVNAKVDGKLKLLPYLGATEQKQTNLYDCKDQLCLTNIDFKFANDGLLEKAARYTNSDPNTTPQQILGSYGALLQLFALQQNDRFLQKTLSSVAMFLQNPKNIAVNAKAKRAVNENALINLMIDDGESLKNNNPMKSNGRVDLSKKPDIKLLDDLRKVFNISFDVNS